MFEKFILKVESFLIKFVGVNWRTTISGIVAVISGFIISSPEALEFLPESVENWLNMLAKIAVLIAGGSFAVLTKDRNVSGTLREATALANGEIAEKKEVIQVKKIVNKVDKAQEAIEETQETIVENQEAIVEAQESIVETKEVLEAKKRIGL